MNRVTDCINKGSLVPFFKGGPGAGISKPENAISSVPGTKLRTQESAFQSKKYSFHSGFTATQSILFILFYYILLALPWRIKKKKNPEDMQTLVTRT